MRRYKILAAVFMTVGLAAGCGTDTADTNTTQVETAADQESVSDKDVPDTTGESKDSEEKTEVRREKYDDCDGSGHGYVEIYYSDGSMETEEY